jgi:heme-degrading monooxygenase HmoA
MYANINRRTRNEARVQETMEVAQREFFPKMKRAKGFISFYVIAEEGGNTTAVSFWENKADADAFRGEAEGWGKTLEAHGHHHQSNSGGEVRQHFTAEK